MIDLLGEEWAAALERRLGATVVEVNAGESGKHRLVVFRKGPLRVGYADFTAGVLSLSADYEEAIQEAAFDLQVDVLRYQAPVAVACSPRYARYALKTAVINSLPEWDERALEKPRRTTNRIARSEVSIRRAESSEAPSIYRLYTETLRRHGGSQRYGQDYFSAIAPHSSWVACLNGAIVAFVATGRVGNRGLYLHGGHREDARRHYPSDLLFLHMIREARSIGLQSFDFLASPLGQPRLLHYKRAWGAEEQPVIVSDHPLSWKGRMFSLSYAAAARLRASLIC
jgi:hypothetical protein